MNENHQGYDLVVIGAGAAGLVTASGAARMGLRVAIVEKHRFGGECLWTGCVPSKALIACAKVKHTMDRAATFGVEPCGGGKVDFSAVMNRMKSVIRTIEPHDNPKRFQEMGVETIIGEARFTGPDTIEVNGRVLRAGFFCIATGSAPFIPPIEGLREANPLTFETFFDQETLPEHLLIIGGGPIGMEMAQTFRRLGSKVTVFEAAPRILIKDDPELTGILRRILEKEGIEILTGVRVKKVMREGGTIRVCSDAEGKKCDIVGDRLLVATGKRPRIEGLGLDRAGVKVEKGRLVVDDTLRTTNPRIYACGDAAGRLQFTHWAEHSAGVVLINAFVPFVTRKVETRIVPWCTYVDPELAHVGEQEADAKGRLGEKGVRVWKYEIRRNDRHLIEGETEGLVKVVTDASGKILGASILSPSAGEMIHEYALAIKLGAKIDDVSSMIHAYPTLIQANKRAADLAMAQKYLTGWKPKLVSWLARRRRPRA